MFAKANNHAACAVHEAASPPETQSRLVRADTPHFSVFIMGAMN